MGFYIALDIILTIVTKSMGLVVNTIKIIPRITALGALYIFLAILVCQLPEISGATTAHCEAKPKDNNFLAL